MWQNQLSGGVLPACKVTTETDLLRALRLTDVFWTWERHSSHSLLPVCIVSRMRSLILLVSSVSLKRFLCALCTLGQSSRQNIFTFKLLNLNAWNLEKSQGKSYYKEATNRKWNVCCIVFLSHSFIFKLLLTRRNTFLYGDRCIK